MNKFIFQKERLSDGSRKQRISITTPSTWGFVGVVVLVATILLLPSLLWYFSQTK
jgi:uncharacterized membrane protein